MDTNATINWITNLSAAALQGVLLWYLIVKAIPSIVADFRSEIAAERAHCLEELEKSEQRSKDFLEIATRRNAVNSQ